MNKRVILAKRPEGMPQASDFIIKSEPLSLDLASGEVLVKVEWSSIDPAQRIWISGKKKSYFPSVAIGQEIRAYGIGVVIKSTVKSLKLNTYVYGLLGWQHYCKIDHRRVFRLPKEHPPNIYLGVLGLTGLSAYVAVEVLARPRNKEVVVVSSAAGSVGSIACQIAKMKGCVVVGITGTPEKCRWLMDELKIDAAICYKGTNVSKQIRKLCPNGVDVYIDNVGGEICDAVLQNIKKNSRIILCGAISGYNLKHFRPITNYPIAISMSATFIGFMVNDFRHNFTVALKTLSRWLANGKLKYKEHILTSLEQAPEGLSMLLQGLNDGKMLIKLNSPEVKL